MKKDSVKDFTTGSIFIKMVQFMIPVLIALVLQAMYSAVDLLIVGKFGTTEGISGVSTGANILHTVTIVISSLTTGITVLMGQYLGNGTPKKIGKLLGNAVSFFLVLSLVLTIVLIVFARPISVLMQAPAEAVDQTAEYIRVCGFGVIFIVFYNFISCVFRGLGNSKLPLLFVLIACVFNIGGDLLLVAVFHMDVKGAAIATVVAQAISVIISIFVIGRQSLPFRVMKEDVRFGDEIPHFLKISIPLACQELLTNLSFLALNAFINRLGLDASSGYGVAHRIQAFIMLIPSSIMQCMAAFVAQNVGAGNEKRSRKAMLYGMFSGAVIGVFICLITFFRGDILASIFSNDDAVIARAFEFLKGFAPDAIATCFLFSYVGYFNGHSKSTFVMIQGLIQSFLIRLPVSYFMSIQPEASLTGIGFAAPAATCVGIIMCTVYFIICKKKFDRENMITEA